jgi:putative thiamine transport system permease protein
MLVLIAAMGQTQPRDRCLAEPSAMDIVDGLAKETIFRASRAPHAVYVVIAYSMSIVDVAVILGPSTPPTLSVQIVKNG